MWEITSIPVLCGDIVINQLLNALSLLIINQQQQYLLLSQSSKSIRFMLWTLICTCKNQVIKSGGFADIPTCEFLQWTLFYKNTNFAPAIPRFVKTQRCLNTCWTKNSMSKRSTSTLQLQCVKLLYSVLPYSCFSLVRRRLYIFNNTSWESGTTTLGLYIIIQSCSHV